MNNGNDESAASIFDLRSQISAMPATSDHFHEFLIVSEAAKYLRVAESTLYGWIHARKIPFRKHGSRVVFCRNDLESWSRSCDSEHLKDVDSNPPTSCGKQASALKPAKRSLKSEQNFAEATILKKGGRRGSM